jgi:hypothetical protein
MDVTPVFRLGQLPEIEPSTQLLPRILCRLRELRLRQLRLRLAGSIFGLLFTVALATWNASVLGNELARSSPFWGFVNLLRTDPDIAAASAQEFTYAILESLPVESIVLALLFCLVLGSVYFFSQALRGEHQGMLHQHKL